MTLIICNLCSESFGSLTLLSANKKRYIDSHRKTKQNLSARNRAALERPSLHCKFRRDKLVPPEK